MKKALSLILAFVLFLGMMPMQAFAASDADSTPTDWSGASAVFVGDSITAGSGTTKIYYEYLEESLGFDSVTPMGVAGSCISAASDYGQSNQPLINRYQDIPSADLIVIFMGTNDYGHETPLGSVEDTQDGTFYGALNAIIPALVAKHPSSKLVFVTPLHRYGFGTSAILGTQFTSDDIANGVGVALGDYVDALKTVCANHGVSVIDLYTECTLDPADAETRTNYMPDGLHPNAAGHEVIAGIMESHIRTFEPAEQEPVQLTEMVYGNRFAAGNDQTCRASSRINYYLKAGTVITLKDSAAMQWACTKTSDETGSANLGYFPDSGWSDKETAVVEADGWVGFVFKYRDETRVFDLTKPLSDYITIEEPHTHTYENGVCTCCGVAQWDTDGNGALEILAIGNSFSVDALEYAYQIAQNLGIEEIVIGNLYIGGCSLATHATNAAGDLTKYTYYYNDDGTWTSTKSHKISTALDSRSWDYVSLQQASSYSGVESTYNEDLTNLIAYVQAHSDAKLVWHMTWAYQQDSTHKAFATYGSDQMTMYKAIVSTVQNKIVTNSAFDLIVPNGTAVQNSRTSLLGDTTTRDGYHMSKDYGRYLTGLLFIKTVTGLSVDNITYAPSGVDAEEMAIAIESVNNAAAKPFDVTQSAYVEEDQEIPDEGYILLQSELYKGAYWHPLKEGRYNELLCDMSSSHKYFATIRFTRETLPVGSIIVLADGWQYRPDGWVTDTLQTGTREPVTTESYVVVTEDWWGDYTIRAFNISKVGLPSLANVSEEEVRAAFRIYVPEEKHIHISTSTVTAPTCTEQGYTTHTCTLCGDSYAADFVDATGHSYENGTCTLCGAATSPYLQQLPENITGCSNLYDLLTPVKGYYTATKYDTGNGAVLSVVIPVEPGDRIAASSFGPVAENMGSVDGIRVTYLLDGTIVESLSAGSVYTAYTQDGYLTVPEGVNMVSVPWWKPSDRNWLTLSQISKNFASHSPKTVSAQAPTCTEKGYTAGDICEICGASLGTREEIPAAGHEYDGTTCTVCGAVNLPAILDGKYVSVLGDSISTFNGYSNDAAVNTTIGGNGPRYDAGAADTKPGSYCLLESVDDTWWMNFANRSGMKLLVNNSWAGSQVFGGQTSDGRVIPAAYLERCVNLHDNTLENNPNNAPINPDVIFVYLGINDYNFNRGNVGEGAVDYASLINPDGTYVTPATFGEAYGILLHKMQQAYPNAQIFAMTLLPENLYSVDMTAWEQHNAYIRSAAEYYDIPVVDLAEQCAITWDNYSGYMMDKIHPTTAGMKLISDCIQAELVAYYTENPPHTHTYALTVTAPTCTEQGYTTYTCACGDSYVGDYVDAAGHSYESGICTACGAEDPNAATPMSLRYDDHLDMTGKTVEIIDAGTPTSYQVGYGVEENTVLDTAVVTLDGNTLVATGIGTAKVKIDGEVYEITVTAAPISLLLLIGQSNMQGSEGNADQSIVCPDGMVYSTYGDRYTMTTDNAANFAPSALTGVGSALNVNGTTTNLEDWPVYLLNEAGAGKAGPDSGFAYEWVKQTGEKVWVVNAAHGGTSISVWQKGTTQYEECLALFSACQETLRKEIAAGHFTLSHTGYFWCQGCTDYSQTAQWYVQKYLAMHNNLKTELAFDENTTFEFGGIIPVRAGHEYYTSYRQGVYADTTSKAYHESFKDLRFTGPRVAQYWMINNPDLPDIWGVCNIGEDWVWMPDGTNGVSDYFQAHYENGTVDYITQVWQAESWYTPTTPKAVHDSIHYNQIGYNEVGRESARNALIMLGEIEAPEVEVTVEFQKWDGYTTAETVTAATAGSSGTLVVPKVYPIWKSKEVTYELSDGLTWDYYDLLADSPLTDGKLCVIGSDLSVSVSGRELGSYSWELENGLLVSSGETENKITLLSGSFENGVFLDTQYQLETPITLLHDQNWVLEWKMTGPWYDDATTSQKLFCQDSASASPSAWCLLIKGNQNRITIGYYGTTTHISYGLDLGNYGISMVDTHVYRLVNHINDDGTNTIYLFVDGVQVGPMTHYFTGSGGDMGEESDYLSGKDISFGYLGTPKYLLDNGVIEYISVMESGASQDIHFHDWSEWEIVAVPSADGPGLDQRTCTGCGETETRTVESIWQTTNIADHWNELPEDVCGNLNLWSALEHDPKYYVVSKGDWGYHSSRNVPSVTFAVNPGDKIFATAFGAASVNGHGSANGIRVTWFDISGVVKTTDPAGTYAEFTKNGGYLVAPDGAIAVNVAMWNNSDDNEIYILNRDHTYTATITAPTCTEQGYTTYTCACGDSYVGDYVDAAGHSYESGICTACGAVAPSLAGKTISILGASISTYAGTSNGAAADTTNSTIRDNAKYYPHSVVTDVTLNDTWWMQVCSDLGLRLLVNNSWSGSSLLYTRNGTVGAYVDRCVQLHDDTGDNAGEEPDIIGIQMGTNDFQYYKDTLGTADIDYDALITDNGDSTYSYAEPVTSLEAAAIALHKISVRYPNAEVYYLNISQRVDGTDELIQSFNAELKEVVEHFDAHIVDIYDSVITMEDFDTYIGDGRVHPNKQGMDVYSEAFKRALLENTAYAVDTHTVSMTLDGVTADYGDDKIVVDGSSYRVNLSAPTGMGLNVTVTMGSENITSAVYANGSVAIDSVTNDVTITAKAVYVPKDYRWEFDGTDLACVEGDNTLTKNAGTTTDGVFHNTAYSLARSVILRHDVPWSVEWRSEGTFENSGSSTGARIFTSDNVNANYNAHYIFKSNKNGIVAMGEKTTSGSHNYGIALGDYGIDWTAEHTYRLENRLSNDGGNMVYLFVDGVEIGPMDDYYVGTTDKNTQSDWLSGKDFIFSYMGTDTHGFTNCSIEYIQVWEGGHIHSYTPAVTAPTCTEQGYTTHTCSICGDSYVDSYVNAAGHSFGPWTEIANEESQRDCSNCDYHETRKVVVAAVGEGEYFTLNSAIKAAGALENGGTVTLLVDLEAPGVVIPADVTLNLTGFTLTTDYLVGLNGSYLTATPNSGKLFVAMGDLVLSEEGYKNTTGQYILPIWDPNENCYLFSKFVLNTDSSKNRGLKIDEATETINFQFKHQATTAINQTLLRDGASDNALNVIVRLEWSNDKGIAYQDFVYNDNFVEKVTGSNDYTFTLTGYSAMDINLSTLKVTGMIITDSGAVACGTVWKVADSSN